MHDVSCCLDGQKIAKRLSVQVSKETKRIRNLLQHYNHSNISLEMPEGSNILLENVFDLKVPFWKSCPNVSCPATTSIPIPLKQEIIRSYVLLERSSEEIGMIEQDMDSTVKYEAQRMCFLLERIHELREGPKSSLNSGAMAVLQNQYLLSKLHLLETLDFFKGIIPIPPEAQLYVEDRNAPSQADEFVDDDSDDDSDDEMSGDDYYDS